MPTRAGYRNARCHDPRPRPDLAIHLAVPAIASIYPLPNRTTVGLEVPNPRPAQVRLRAFVEKTREFPEMALPLFLGEGRGGRPMTVDLARLGHLLIAGTTGSGKSTCQTTVLLSMLLTRTPEDLKLILVDPKRVELSAFKDIPHLMSPVVTDVKRAPLLLDWLVRQMSEVAACSQGRGEENRAVQPLGRRKF